MKQIWFVLLVAFSPMAAWAQQADDAPDCASVATCIAVLQSFGIDPPLKGMPRFDYIDTQMLAKPVQRLATFGELGVEALMKLLEHPNSAVRMRAAYALGRFQNVDPRHLHDLIAAMASGGSWLYRPIAATGTDEALAYLWQQFLRDARAWERSGVEPSLSMFGERLYPHIRAELERCQTSREDRVCRSVVGLADDLKPLPGFFMPMIEAVARSSGASEEIRVAAEDELIRKEQLYGQTILLKRLKAALTALGPAGASSFRADGLGVSGLPLDWDTRFLISDIEKYREVAADAGPLLIQLLKRRDMPESRAAAALAIGKLNFGEGAATLLAQSATFEDDWLFAYNAVESLGLLRFEPARETLKRVVQTYWHEPVRRNAERALSVLDGGEFKSPHDFVDDGMVMIGPGMKYRHGDDRVKQQTCVVTGAQPYEQFFVEAITWPDAKDTGSAHGLDLQLSSIAETPLPEGLDFRQPYGDVRFVLKTDDGVVAGLDAGEFGGGIYHVDRSGKHRLLVDDNGIAAFRTGKAIFMITGLSHLSSSSGVLWVLDVSGERPEVRRRVRLPVEPESYALVGPDTLVIKSSYGDVGVQSDGTLVDVRNIGGCGVS